MTKEEYNDISAALDRIMKRVADDETRPKKAAIGAVGVLGGFQLFIKEYYEKHSTATLKGLDEAAEEQAKSFGYMSFDYEFDENVESFKAGAKWMAERGCSFEGVIRPDKENSCSAVRHNVVIVPDTFNLGDKVIVQIRKKAQE